MSNNYYSEINLHVVWHTKGSSPLLVPKVEAIVHHTFAAAALVHQEFSSMKSAESRPTSIWS